MLIIPQKGVSMPCQSLALRGDGAIKKKPRKVSLIFHGGRDFVIHGQTEVRVLGHVAGPLPKDEPVQENDYKSWLAEGL